MSGRCPAINDLKLSHEGEFALRNIKKIIQDTKRLQNVLMGGTLLSYLFNDSVAINFINVRYTDWTLLAQAVQGLSAVEQRLIELETGTQMIRSMGGEEYEFWEALHNHCKPN